MNTKYEHVRVYSGSLRSRLAVLLRTIQTEAKGNSTATRGDQSNANSQRVKKQTNHSGGRGSGTADN